MKNLRTQSGKKTFCASGAVSAPCALIARIRAKSGCEEKVGAALEKVASAVLQTEKSTLGYHVCRSASDLSVFYTFERFADRAAMEAHNASAAVSSFVAEVEGCLAEQVEITVLDECVAVVREADQGER